MSKDALISRYEVPIVNQLRKQLAVPGIFEAQRALSLLISSVCVLTGGHGQDSGRLQAMRPGSHASNTSPTSV